MTENLKLSLALAAAVAGFALTVRVIRAVMRSRPAQEEK